MSRPCYHRIALAILSLSLVLPLPASAEVECVTTHYDDGTCQTTCIFWDSQGRPAGRLQCKCC